MAVTFAWFVCALLSSCARDFSAESEKTLEYLSLTEPCMSKLTINRWVYGCVFAPKLVLLGFTWFWSIPRNFSKTLYSNSAPDGWDQLSRKTLFFSHFYTSTHFLLALLERSDRAKSGISRTFEEKKFGEVMMERKKLDFEDPIYGYLIWWDILRKYDVIGSRTYTSSYT